MVWPDPAGGGKTSARRKDWDKDGRIFHQFSTSKLVIFCPKVIHCSLRLDSANMNELLHVQKIFFLMQQILDIRYPGSYTSSHVTPQASKIYQFFTSASPGWPTIKATSLLFFFPQTSLSMLAEQHRPEI